MLTLILRSLQRIKMLTIVVSAILTVFQLAIVAYATGLESHHRFDQLEGLIPEFVRTAFGAALMSFKGMATLGFVEPLIVMMIVQFAIYVAAEPAYEVETGLVDLIMARALPRHRLVTRSLIVMTAASVYLPSVLAISLWGSLAWLADPGAARPSTHVVWSLTGHLATVTWCFGSIALAAGAWAERRGTAQSLVGVMAVGLYLVDVVAQAWSKVAWTGWVSPFHYYDGPGIINGATHPARDLSVMLGIGVVGIAAAYWKFSTRDL